MRLAAAQIGRVAFAPNFGMCARRHVLFFPCPIPPAILRPFERLLQRVFRLLPSPIRREQFEVVARCASASWRGSPYFTDVLAPSLPPLDMIGECPCLTQPNSADHLLTRDWQLLPCCQSLYQLIGDTPLQMRVFPPWMPLLPQCNLSWLKSFTQLGSHANRDCSMRNWFFLILEASSPAGVIPYPSFFSSTAYAQLCGEFTVRATSF